MKKLITAALALSMTVSAFAPCAFADDGLDKIVSEVKARASITDEYTDFSSDYSEETDGYTEYHFSWTSEDDEKSVNINYNSDGIITNYRENHEFEHDKGLSLPKVSLEEAKKSAQEFLDKLNPASKGEYIVMDTNMGSALDGDYSFSIERRKNNIPVNDFYGHINVDRTDAKPYSMWISYIPVDEFEDVSSVISKEDAQSAFKEKLGMELVYSMYYDDNKCVVFPTYQQKSQDKYISALTGEVYEPELSAQLYRATAENAMADMASEKEAGGGGLSQVEIEELDKIAGLISKADIEAKVRANETLNIPADLKLSNINLQRDYYDDTQYTYSMSFNGEKAYVSVSADAKTGEIKSFNFNDWSEVSEEESEEIDESKVEAAAQKVFDSLAGDKKSEYRFDKVFGDTVQYTRYVNDIKVNDDTINISVDNDGRLISYYLRYTANAQFPSIDGVISADEAADKLFEAVNYDINYYFVSGEDEKVIAKALYMFDNTGFINPFTGELVNYRNETNTNDAKVYEYGDIDKHWAKEQITKLADYGIGFDGDFMPDEKITERDFLYLLTKTFNPYSEFDNDEDLYRAAVSYGYLSDKKESDSAPAVPVTRERAAIMMIKAMGAESYAEYEDIYVTPFKDVTENKGYIALLSAMKVVKGDTNGNFNPKNNMTRAEAACMIYNYLIR